MMKKLTLTLIFSLAGGGLVTSQEGALETEGWASTTERWEAALGSTEFKKRFDASMEIWTAGDRAIGFLNALAEGDDPEVAARASNLSLMIRSGISPDTPAKTVELVNRFFATNATTPGKIAVLEELRQLEEYGFIFRLRSLEEDERVVEKADELIENVLPRLVRKLTSEGDFGEVKSILSLGTELPEMIAYASLLENIGELDDEIARLRNAGNPEDQARYLACLRVKGDAGLLQFEAQRLGDRDAEVLATLALGDHVPYFEHLAANEDLNLSERHYLNWSLAKIKGDQKKAEEIKNALVHLTQDESEKSYARMNLYRMGFQEEVVAGLEPDEIAYLHSYYIGQEDYLKILPLMGLPDGKLTDEWLEECADEFRAGARESGRSSKLFYVADFFERRGQVEEAIRCYSMMFKVIREAGDKKLSTWIPTAFQYGPRATLTVLAKEVEEHDYDLSLVLESLFDSDRLSDWLQGQLKELYPTASVEELLFLTVSFGNIAGGGSGHVLFVSEEKFEEAQDGLIEQVMKSESKIEGLGNLYRLARSRDSEGDIMKLMALSQKEDQEFAPLVLAQFAVQQMKFDEAGKFFAEVELNEKSTPTYSFYEKGAALRKAGLPDADDLCRKARLFSEGSTSDLLSFSSIESRFGYGDKAYALQQKALLRLNLSGTQSGSVVPSAWLMNSLAVGAAERKNWGQAVAFREAVAWETRSGVSIQTLRARFQILLARGAQAMEAGDIVQAARYFTEAHGVIPRDGYLANDFFPLVRELGLVELHDQLFAESARYCRKVIRTYPGDDNALNNFAWMASRANRCLDEAEAYLKKALEMKPRSAAYLDTMGEIYFARRNRAEAVKWSNLSRRYEISDVELQGQNRRFKEGEFPAP
ncbi:hypothetical protein V2O64_03390 [Verrucomicrobiaceae bacterium 227]